jgi:hypothetical protein
MRAAVHRHSDRLHTYAAAAAQAIGCTWVAQQRNGSRVRCTRAQQQHTLSHVQVRSLLPVKELCEEVEKRNKLKLLDKFLKVLVEEGSQDPDVHNAMGKILIDANSNPEHFLQSNPFYQPAVVGKYCEKRCAAPRPHAQLHACAPTLSCTQSSLARPHTQLHA